MNPTESPEQNEQQISMDADFERMPIVSQLAILFVVLAGLLGGALYAPRSDEEPRAEPPQVASAVQATANETESVHTGASFEDATLTAESAIVFDPETNEELYTKNADAVLPIASITKLMTALVASELAANDSEPITISADAVAQFGDSGLLTGEAFTLATLRDFMLISSLNDGAYALAAAAGETLDESEPVRAFVQAMNIRAKELGMNDTYFRNPTGLDVSDTEAGAESTARDIATLLAYMYTHTPDVLEYTTVPSERFFNEEGAFHESENTNHLVARVPGIRASKTGYTTLAGGALAVVFDRGLNDPVVIVVLRSTYSGRFADVQTLAEHARAL